MTNETNATLGGVDEFIAQLNVTSEEFAVAIRNGDNKILGGILELPIIGGPVCWKLPFFGLAKRLGIVGIGVADEAYGFPVTRYYFNLGVDVFLSYYLGYEWGSPYARAKEKEELVLTQEGKERFKELLKDQIFRETLIYPQLYATAVCQIKSVNVYHGLIDGNHYEIRAFSPSAHQEREIIIRDVHDMSFTTPDFVSRLCFTARMVEEMSSWPLRFCRFSALTEYAAGKEFSITEIPPKLRLTDLFYAAGLNGRKKSGSYEANGFLVENDLSKDYLIRVQRELRYCLRLARALRGLGVGVFGGEERFNLDESCLLVHGYCQETGTLDLVPMEQGQAEMHLNDPGGLEASLSYYLETVLAQKAFDRLSQLVDFKAFFQKHGFKRPKSSS